MKEEEIKEEEVVAPKKKRGKRGPKPKPKKRGPKPKKKTEPESEPKPKRDKPGRPPLPPEERERRIKERERKRCEMRKDERERNSTKRFRAEPQRVPSRLKKYLVTPHGSSHRNITDANKDAWLIMKEAAKGHSFSEIAEWMTELNGYKVTADAVYKSVRRAMVEWKKENLKNTDEFIAYELGKLEQLESIVLADYERSRVPKPQEYAALVKQGMTMEEIDKWYEKKGGYPGDPSYLDRLLQISQRKMKMLGIESGVDIATTTIVNYGFDMKDFSELSDIVGRMQDKKHDDLYSEANVVEEVKEEEDGQGDD